jgi:predicted ferric reductase
LGLWFSLFVSLSFLVRKRIGQRQWRRFHYVSFVAFWIVFIHAIVLGTDTRLLSVKLFYLLTAAPVIFLTFYRILGARRGRAARQAAPHSAAAQNAAVGSRTTQANVVR